MTSERTTLRALGQALVACLLWQGTWGAALANPVANPSAPTGKKPIVDAATNGVKVVHIAPPNAARVSHNLYTSFSVPAAGVILNNRSASGSSQLGGTISGNPQLGSVSASLIVNEVNAANASSLLGKLEVAGGVADVVLANPWGITCNGCGFINTSRATLTTGKPVLAGDGRLSSFSVEGGSIAIGSSGLNATSLRELDLLARSISVTEGAVIAAENVYAVGGRASVAYDTLATSAIADASGKPVHAIVVPYNAVINANQIFLVATEQGVGVQNAGSLNARTGGIQIDAQGQLLLSGARLTATGGTVAARGSSLSHVGGKADSGDGLLLYQASGAVALDGLSLAGGEVLVSAGSTLTATGLQSTSTGDARIVAGSTLTIDGGRLRAGGDLSLSAVADLRLGPVFSVTTTPVSGGSVEKKRYVIPELRAGADATLQAGGIVNLDGASVDAGGSIAVSGQTVGLIGPKDYDRTSTTVGGKVTVTEAETLSAGSLHATGDISILATGTTNPASDPNAEHGHILLTGAQVQSDAGQVSLLAQRDVDIANDVVSSSYFQEYWTKKKRLLYTKTTHVITSSTDQEVKPSVVGGQAVSIAAGRDLNVVASSILADGAIGLHADNDLDLLSTGEVHQSYNLHSVKKSGVFGSGSFGITIGSSKRTDVSNMLATQQIGSIVGSTFGDVAVTAGNQALVLSSEILAAQGNVHVAAREVAIQTNNNTRSLINSVRQTQSGITLSAGHPLITAAQTVVDMQKAVERTKDPRLEALGIAAAGLSIYQAYKDLSKTKSTNPADGNAQSPWTFNVTLGSSSYAFDSVYKESLPQESQILAGRNLTVKATGSAAAQQGDISVIGSALSAGGDLNIQANNDLFLTAATAKSTDQTRTRASSGAVGITLSGTNPTAITIAASKTRGFANGWGTTYFPVELTAGGTLNFSSARHTNASGAQLDGQRVVGRVGTGGAGDLMLASPQDQSHFIAKESSLGFNLSIPLSATAPTLGVSVSQLKLLADWQSAREQTAIRAGSGGFDISVNGTTYLRGAAITSTAASSSNKLVTQTLLHETLTNRDNTSGSASSLTLSYTRKDGQGALAGSAFGYAEINRSTTGHTASAVSAGTVSVTRSDLQTGIAANWYARERTPVANELASEQDHLTNLLYDEPPKYPGQQINGGVVVETQPAGEIADSGDGSGVSAVGGTPTPEWTAWNNEVTATRNAITKLNAQLAVIDARVYGQPNTLSRSPNTSHVPLRPALDPQRATEELRAGVAITAAFGKAAFKEAGDYADRKRNDALKACGGNPQGCTAYEDWKEGGRARTLLHAIIGGLGYGTSGAVGATANQLATPVIEQVLIDAGLATRNQTTGVVTYTGLGDAVRLAAGAAIGAGVGGGQAGAAAFNADANNRQLHPDIQTFITDAARVRRYAQQRGISEAAAAQELVQAAAALNDAGWARVHPQAVTETVRAFLMAESAQLRLPDGTTYFTPSQKDYEDASRFVVEALSGRGRDLYRANLAVPPEMLAMVSGTVTGGLQGGWNALKAAFQSLASVPESLKGIYSAMELAAQDPARAAAALKLAMQTAPAAVVAELRKTVALIDLYSMYGDHHTATAIATAAALNLADPTSKLSKAAHFGAKAADAASDSLRIGAALAHIQGLVGRSIDLPALSLNRPGIRGGPLV